MKIESPNVWGEDSLSKAIDVANAKTIYTFYNKPEEHKVFVDVDTLFETLTDNLTSEDAEKNWEDWYYLLLIPRCHSAYRAATRLALSGQNPEAYAFIRLCVEYAFYTFYMYKNPERVKIFCRRDEDDDSAKKMRNEFSHKKMANALTAINPQIGEDAETLYLWLIDDGAHPNPIPITAGLSIEEKKNGTTQILTKYFDIDSVIHEICLVNAKRAGVCSLEIFRLILPDLFDTLGLDLQLDKLNPPPQ